MTDATAPDPESLRKEFRRQYQRVLSLRSRLYAQADPSADLPLQQRLAAEEAGLNELESRVNALAPPAGQGGVSTSPRGNLLGAKTTGLRVERTLHMKPLPTGVYNLLDPETDPLLTVTVANESREPRRVCVRVYIEGLSAEEVHTVEIDPRKQATFRLLPALLPERSRMITEVQRARATTPSRSSAWPAPPASMPSAARIPARSSIFPTTTAPGSHPVPSPSRSVSAAPPT
jgi:hypothetical protein